MRISSIVFLLFISGSCFSQSMNDTINCINEIKKLYSDIKKIVEFDSVTVNKVEFGEEIFAGAEEKYLFHKKGKVIKVIELVWGSGEGGINNATKREIYFENSKPRFVFERHIVSVYGLGQMKEDCESNNNCVVLVENRTYINGDSFVVRKLGKKVSLDNETKILNKISNTPNVEVKFNKGEKYEINYNSLKFEKIENCVKTDVNYPNIFPEELNEGDKFNFIEPGMY